MYETHTYTELLILINLVCHWPQKQSAGHILNHIKLIISIVYIWLLYFLCFIIPYCDIKINTFHCFTWHFQIWSKLIWNIKVLMLYRLHSSGLMFQNFLVRTFFFHFWAIHVCIFSTVLNVICVSDVKHRTVSCEQMRYEFSLSS